MLRIRYVRRLFADRVGARHCQFSPHLVRSLPSSPASRLATARSSLHQVTYELCRQKRAERQNTRRQNSTRDKMKPVGGVSDADAVLQQLAAPISPSVNGSQTLAQSIRGAMPSICRRVVARSTFVDRSKSSPRRPLRFLSPDSHKATECDATEIHRRQNSQEKRDPPMSCRCYSGPQAHRYSLATVAAAGASQAPPSLPKIESNNSCRSCR